MLNVHLRYILMSTALFLPPQVWSAYDMEKIKERITANPSFKVSGWSQSPTNHHWQASTSLKTSSIIVNEKKAELTLPFINPTHKKSAKILCAEFAALTLATSKEKELAEIKEIIRKSTTRHQIKFAKLSDMTFYVVPKLVGMRVSLHCTVKTK